MKAKLTAAEHAAIDPSLQGEYKPAEDGTFDLNIEGAPTGFVADDQVTQLQSNTAGLNSKISEIGGRARPSQNATDGGAGGPTDSPTAGPAAGSKAGRCKRRN